MKKLVAFILLMAVFSSFSPFAVAVDTLGKPSAGQVIFMEADNNIDYKADFSLSALTGAFRDGDDLRLEFPAARLTLKGFFTPLGEWRSIIFSDGNSIGGVDFDDEGNFTGSFHSVLDMGKGDQSLKLEAKAAGMQAATALVRVSPYGTQVIVDGEDIWGPMRDSCMQAFELIFPADKPDWSTVLEYRYEFLIDDDGSMSPLRSYTDFADGISTQVIKPECVHLSGSLSMLPMSEGRAAISFLNRRGELLIKVDVLCRKDDSGTLQLSCDCESCGAVVDGTLHFLPCGHYSCSEDFDAALHDLAPCQVAGHCASESEHEKCSNCLEYTCDGQVHGIGSCEHVHNWVAVTLVSSRCTGCGFVYTRN